MTRWRGLLLGIRRCSRRLRQGARNLCIKADVEDFVPVGLGEERVGRCETDDAEFVGGLVDVLVASEDFEACLEIDDLLRCLGCGVLF